MDQVTISCTLGKVLGGASGACRVVSPESAYPHAGPWRPVREGREGGPGAAEKRAAGTVLSGGTSVGSWPLTAPAGPLVSLLRQRARPYLFSNSLPPAVVGCASKALDLLMESNAIVQSMAAETQP